MIKSGIQLAEKGYIPDFILKQAINQLLKGRLNQIPKVDDLKTSSKLSFFEELKTAQLLFLQMKQMNEHYEVPPSFFKYVMSDRLKYSCCWYENDDDNLMQAEINMIEKTISRAEIDNNQEILDLGCGWGSFSLHAAKVS